MPGCRPVLLAAVLMQARGVRWAIIAVAGLVGFLAGLSHWVIAKV